MAYTLTSREVNDLLLGTFDDYGAPSFTQIATDLQRYEFMSFLLNEDRMMFDSGIGLKRMLMTKYEDVAEWVGLHQAADIKITDHLAQLDVPWRHVRTHWAMDVKETFMNKGKSLITNVIKPRETGGLLALADKLETAGWRSPSTTDETSMYGIPYYVVYNGTDGFTGATPGSHTTVAGVNPTTHPGYKNYSHTYVNFTPDDWLLGARMTHLKTEFISPVTEDDFRGDTGQRFRIYTDDAGMTAMWLMADQQNMNIGWDFGKMDNQTTFKGNAFRYVPKLDSGNKDDSVPAGPFYFIDRGAFILAALGQDYMRRSEAINSQSQPDSYVTFVNASLNLLFVNRRTCGIMATGA